MESIAILFLHSVTHLFNRVMAALNFLRYLLIRDKLAENKVQTNERSVLKCCYQLVFLCSHHTDRFVECTGEGQGAVHDSSQKPPGGNKGTLQA